MKRLSTLLMVMATMLLTACSSDDEPKNSEDYIYATWDAVEIYQNGAWQPVTEKNAMTLSFSKDKTCWESGWLGTIDGTFVLNNGKATIFWRGNKYSTEVEVKSLSKDEARLVYHLDPLTWDYKCKRRK